MGETCFCCGGESHGLRKMTVRRSPLAGSCEPSEDGESQVVRFARVDRFKEVPLCDGCHAKRPAVVYQSELPAVA